MLIRALQATRQRSARALREKAAKASQHQVNTATPERFILAGIIADTQVQPTFSPLRESCAPGLLRRLCDAQVLFPMLLSALTNSDRAVLKSVL